MLGKALGPSVGEKLALGRSKPIPPCAPARNSSIKDRRLRPVATAYVDGPDGDTGPSTSGRPDAARGLTYERQLSTLQGLVQAQASTIAALQAEIAALKSLHQAQQLQGQQLQGQQQQQQQQQQHGHEPRGPSPLPSESEAAGVSGYPSFTLEDFRRLPDRLILVRHAESVGNLDATRYAETPDYEIPLSARGFQQAVACGEEMRALLEGTYGPDAPYRLHFITSPYTRSRQTFVGIRQAFGEGAIASVHESVQLREQDFGNFQVPHRIAQDIKERNRFGRFYYRFPDGESTADVYDRVAILEDDLLRDIRAGEFGAKSTIVVISHGLTLRVFMMRWFNWSVEQFLQIYNPPNASPLLISKVSEEDFLARSRKHAGKRQTLRIKNCYELDRGCMVEMLKLSPEATLEACDLIGQVWMG